MFIIIYIVWAILFASAGLATYCVLQHRKDEETREKWKVDGLFESAEYNFYDRSCQCDHLCGSKENECCNGKWEAYCSFYKTELYSLGPCTVLRCKACEKQLKYPKFY